MKFLSIILFFLTPLVSYSQQFIFDAPLDDIKKKGIVLMDEDLYPILKKEGTGMFTFTKLLLVDSDETKKIKNAYVILPGSISYSQGGTYSVWFFGRSNELIQSDGKINTEAPKLVFSTTFNYAKLAALSFVNQALHSFENNPDVIGSAYKVNQLKKCYDISELDNYKVNFMYDNLHKSIDTRERMARFFPTKFSILSMDDYNSKLLNPEPGEAFAFWHSFMAHLVIYCPYDHKLLYFSFIFDTGKTMMDDFLKPLPKKYYKSLK